MADLTSVVSMAEELAEKPVESLPTFDDAALLDAEPFVPEAFHVHDANTANWVVRKINEARERAERAKAWAAKEAERAARDEAFFLGRFGAEMAAWTRGEIDGSRRKSVDLPAGRAGFRTKPAALIVDDESKTLAWAETNCQAAVVVKRSLSKSALNDAFAKSGEVPDGAHVEDASEKFYIK